MLQVHNVCIMKVRLGTVMWVFAIPAIYEYSNVADEYLQHNIYNKHLKLNAKPITVNSEQLI